MYTALEVNYSHRAPAHIIHLYCTFFLPSSIPKILYALRKYVHVEPSVILNCSPGAFPQHVSARQQPRPIFTFSCSIIISTGNALLDFEIFPRRSFNPRHYPQEPRNHPGIHRSDHGFFTVLLSQFIFLFVKDC